MASRTENMILAELREIKHRMKALETPAARAAQRELEALDAEAAEAERAHLRKVNARSVEKLLAQYGGKDAPRNPHGAKGNGLEHP